MLNRLLKKLTAFDLGRRKVAASERGTDSIAAQGRNA